MASDTQGRTGQAGGFYSSVWRWHFYAGLFCIPFVIWLACSEPNMFIARSSMVSAAATLTSLLHGAAQAALD